MSFFQEFFNSGTDEQQSKRRLGALLIAVTAALLAVALIILMVASIVTAVKNKTPDDDDEGGNIDLTTPPANYTTTTFADTQLYSGNLLLLNESHLYAGTADTIQPAQNVRAKDDAGNNLYRGDYGDIYLTQETLDALNAMMLDFHAAKKSESDYTTGKLYLDSNLAPKSATLSASTKAVIKSGTVLILAEQAMDSTENEVSIYDTTANTGKGVYKWIYDNAYKYGFIRASATEGEENVFRYVGVAHAQYMNEKGKTVAEYIDIIKEKTAHNPLKITVKDSAGDNEVYHVYYLAVGSESMFVPVNVAAYTVSGDNVGGYIITVKTSALKEAK